MNSVIELLVFADLVVKLFLSLLKPEFSYKIFLLNNSYSISSFISVLTGIYLLCGIPFVLY